MNKKIYIIPSMRMHEVKVAKIICVSGGGDVIDLQNGGGTSSIIIPNGGDVKHRDDDFDFGGSSDDWGDGIW